MSETLTMPSLRPEMKSGVLAAWLKEPGERDGVMGRHLVDEGDEVTCGSAIAEIE